MRALRGWPLAWFLLALAFAIRLLSLGSYPLMDTTEARYGEVARKMAELGDWITPWYDVGVPFWGKPPLAFWLSAGGQLLLGANEFASRLPHWLLGVLVLWLVWDWQAREDRRQARIACVLLGSSALFFVASGAVMTDMALALALVLTMRGFWLGLHGAEGIRRREGWLMFLGLGLGLLAKGPLTLILAALPIGLWALLEWRWRALWRGLPWIRGSLLMLLVAAPWYLLAELKTPGFLEYFLLGEHWQRFVTAGWDGDRYGNAHAYPYGSVWLFLLAAAFPWSLWLPLLLWLGWRQRGEVVDGVASRRRYWLFWGLAPCLFFTFAGNVLWTYVLPGLPALALLAADLLRAPLARSAWLRRGGLVCLALTPLLFALFLGSLLLGSRAEQKSTAALLASDAGWRERPLVFWPKRPYSAV
ncbi:ArnT family glycosyltransferase, partial [Pseudomonas aeruginosa]